MSRTPVVHVDETGAVILTIVKAVLVLSAEDLLRLLLGNPKEWLFACRRGKVYRRGLSTARRTGGDQ